MGSHEILLLPTGSVGWESGEQQHSCLAGEGYREQRLPSPGMPFVTWECHLSPGPIADSQ